MTSIDMREVTQLSADFGRAAGETLREVDQVMEKGAINVKKAMVAEAESDGSYKRFSRSISYDRAYGYGTVGYEVGPDKGRRGTQAALGNLLYFGSENNSPVLDIEVGIREETPRLMDHLGRTAERLAVRRG